MTVPGRHGVNKQEAVSRHSAVTRFLAYLFCAFFVQNKSMKSAGIIKKLKSDGWCWRRLNIDAACRLPMTQRDDPELVAGRGVATADSGPVKCRRLGQIAVGADTRGQSGSS